MRVNRRFAEFTTNPLEDDLYVFIGGYGSSKSYSVMQRFVLTLLEEKRVGLVVRQHYSTMKDSVYSLIKEVISNDFQEYIESYGVSPLSVKFTNGSSIIFRGISDPEKLKSINNVSLVFIEEASEIGVDGYRELLGRLRAKDKHNVIMMATNPVSKTNWIYTEFFEKAGVNEVDFYTKKDIKIDYAGMSVKLHHSTYQDNNFLPEQYKARLEGLKDTDPYLYEIACLGCFGVLGEKIFEDIEIVYGDEIPTGKEYGGGDLGYSISYNAFVRVYVDDAKETLTITDELYNKGRTSKELAEDLKDAGFGDITIYTDYASPQIIRELNTYGINSVKCRKVKGQKMQGLKKVKNYKIKVHESCKQTLSDLQSLCYYKDKDGNLHEDRFNFDSHILDGIIYALSYHEPMFKSSTRGYRDPHAAIKYK